MQCELWSFFGTASQLVGFDACRHRAPLAPRGERAARKLVKYMRRERIRPALVLCFPAPSDVDICLRMFVATVNGHTRHGGEPSEGPAGPRHALSARDRDSCRHC